MKTETSHVIIKGTKHGLTITLLPGPLSDLLSELSERLQRTAAFFRGAQVTLHVENAEVNAATLQQISGMLAEHDIVLRRIATADPALALAGESLGLTPEAETHTPAPASAPPAREGTREPRRDVPESQNVRPSAPAASLDGEEGGGYSAIVVRRTLRGGSAVHHEGHIIIVGDVNPGAEVIAAGDVIVWGKLRGLVHAGAMGDNGAIVCALLFEPTQLRIGNAIARMPERRKRKSAPEMASIRNGKIEVIEWS